MSREEILHALKTQKPNDGLLAYKKRGRPFSTSTKKQIAIRLDPEVLEAFQKEGPGWQTRINNALKDWLQQHEH